MKLKPYITFETLKSPIVKNKLAVFFILCLISIIGTVPAIYNGFPLLNSDSGTYIAFTVLDSAPIDRSVFYSYFIKITGLGKTSISTIFAQSFIGTSLIFLLIYNHFGIKRAIKYSLSVIILLSIFTPYAWYVSQLNPDIFMAFFALAFIGILSYESKNRFPFAYYFFIVFLSASIHNSILLFCLIYCIIGLLYALFKKKKGYSLKFIVLFTGVLFTYILASWINYKHHKVFSPNPSSHIFVLSRLVELSIVDSLLAEECTSKKYQLCDEFKGGETQQCFFMWHGEYHHNTMGWLDKNVIEEYNDIIKTSFTTPKYLLTFIRSNSKDAFNLLFTTSINAGLVKFVENSSPWNNIKTFMPKDYRAFESAKQQNNSLPIEAVNTLVKWGILMFFILLAILYFNVDRKNKFKYFPFILFIISMCILNSFITTSVSTNLERYNARMVWVIPFGLLLAYFKAKDHSFHKNQ